MGESKHILIIEDYAELRESLDSYLKKEGFRVSHGGSGDALWDIMAKDPADLVVMDLGLPGEDGLELTRKLREQYSCGIIIATGKTDLVDRVVGLELGADDYVSKPYEFREILARIRSVLRRGSPLEPAPKAEAVQPRDMLAFGPWKLDLERRCLFTHEGGEVSLTSGEFNLLSEFVAKPGRVLSREQLLQAVHNRNWEYFDRSIDVLVTRLRHKLEQGEGKPEFIKTVRGTGYVFTAPVKHQAA